MQSIKTPYYPNKQLYVRVTPLGALVVYPENDIYDKPINGRTILKIDAVKYLEELWGENTVGCREIVYRLVSGDCSDSLYKDTLISMYKRFRKFADYVDERWIFGNKNESEITRIIKPAREFVNSKIEDIKRQVNDSGGKFLLCTNDYVYAAYTHEGMPKIKHAEVIRC